MSFIIIINPNFILRFLIAHSYEITKVWFILKLLYSEKKKEFSRTIFGSAASTKPIESSASQLKNHRRFCAIIRNYEKFRPTMPNYERFWISTLNYRWFCSSIAIPYRVTYFTVRNPIGSALQMRNL